MRLRFGGGGAVVGLVVGLTLCAAQPDGFPCDAGEWIDASWRPGDDALVEGGSASPPCRSCWRDCSAGQFCRPRGGCVNCTAGEYDADGEPNHPCKACPKGKTSGEGATACTAVRKTPCCPFLLKSMI